jgi:hypothetical protein
MPAAAQQTGSLWNKEEEEALPAAVQDEDDAQASLIHARRSAE